ncbi:MAG: hypothetical protein IIX39_07210, partial [Clostridia bacterium]|nr:hypothetical protein [Clostridia bacterium]
SGCSSQIGTGIYSFQSEAPNLVPTVSSPSSKKTIEKPTNYKKDLVKNGRVASQTCCDYYNTLP